jgi:RNA polymerase sigma-54 factor
MLGEYIIGNIDEDGYLRREIPSITDDLAFLQNMETTEEELLEVLKVIQDFDPAGVGHGRCRSACAADFAQG